MKFKEDDLQKRVARYLDVKKVLWFHCANERRTTMQAGARLKAKGVKSGVPDCLILKTNTIYNGLAIELKIKPNKPTAKQIEWLDKLTNEGWKTAICFSFDEALKEIDEYLLIK